jgi:hypothetical protein
MFLKNKTKESIKSTNLITQKIINIRNVYIMKIFFKLLVEFVKIEKETNNEITKKIKEIIKLIK